MPKIFLATTDKILRSVAKCVCNQDDILVGVVDTRENLQTEGDVLERLQKYNVCLNLRKCVFLKKQVACGWTVMGCILFKRRLMP